MFHLRIDTENMKEEDKPQPPTKPEVKTEPEKNDTKPGLFKQLYKAEFTGNQEDVNALLNKMNAKL
jgi:hypothetical protein